MQSTRKCHGYLLKVVSLNFHRINTISVQRYGSVAKLGKRNPRYATLHDGRVDFACLVGHFGECDSTVVVML